MYKLHSYCLWILPGTTYTGATPEATVVFSSGSSTEQEIGSCNSLWSEAFSITCREWCNPGGLRVNGPPSCISRLPIVQWTGSSGLVDMQVIVTWPNCSITTTGGNIFTTGSVEIQYKCVKAWTAHSKREQQFQLDPARSWWMATLNTCTVV